MRTQDGNKKMPSTKRRSEGTYSRYVYKVMKRVHPDLGISAQTISATNGIVDHVASRLVEQSRVVAKLGKKTTLSARHVQAATKIVLPLELAKHAVSEGTRAVTKFAA